MSPTPCSDVYNFNSTSHDFSIKIDGEVLSSLEMVERLYNSIDFEKLKVSTSIDEFNLLFNRQTLTCCLLCRAWIVSKLVFLISKHLFLHYNYDFVNDFKKFLFPKEFEKFKAKIFNSNFSLELKKLYSLVEVLSKPLANISNYNSIFKNGQLFFYLEIDDEYFKNHFYNIKFNNEFDL